MISIQIGQIVDFVRIYLSGMKQETISDSVEEAQVINEELIRIGIEGNAVSDEAKEHGDNKEIKDVKILSLSYQNLISIVHLDDFHALTKLQLDNNHITKIENLQSLTNLEWLDLSFNRIKKIEGLENLTKLTDLSLFYNHIDSIDGLDMLKNLHILSLGNNNITTIEDIEKLRTHKDLKILKLSGNPISRMESYRSYILSRMNHLENLDSFRVLKQGVEDAKEHYQDDLLEIVEKEEVLEQKMKIKKELEEREALMNNANLEGVETLMINMETLYHASCFHANRYPDLSDQDWKKLCTIPGMSEAWNDNQNKFSSFTEEFKQSMLAQLELKSKETERWQNAMKRYLQEKDETCKSWIQRFEKQKKREVTKFTNGEASVDDVMAHLKMKLTRLQQTLFGIEEEVIVTQNHFTQEYEAACDQLISKEKTLLVNFFTQVGLVLSLCSVMSDAMQTRDLLNDLSSRANTAALGMLEKYVRESDVEKLPEEAKDFLNDKDLLMTALQNTYDHKISKVDILEEELLQKVAFKSQQRALDVDLNTKKRHSERIHELLCYFHRNAEDIEELEQEKVNQEV